jgi:hypothetical protein
MEPIEVLRRRIEERKSSIALFMTNGGCKSMDDYARATGKYEMLESLLQDISEIEKRYIAD